MWPHLRLERREAPCPKRRLFSELLAELLYDLTPYEWSLVLRYRRRGYLLNIADSNGQNGVARPSRRCADGISTRTARSGAR